MNKRIILGIVIGATIAVLLVHLGFWLAVEYPTERGTGALNLYIASLGAMLFGGLIGGAIWECNE